jgi:D-alanyl-D-alanine carboxypeptidase
MARWRSAGGMTMSFQEGAPVWPGPYLRGYGNFLPGSIWHRNYTDETDCSMALFGAAGSGISAARDLAFFMRALVTGQLLPDDLYQQMIDGLPTDLGPGVTYGNGIIREDLCGTVLLGHGGSVWGYQSNAYSTIDGIRTLAMGFPLYPGTDAMWNGVGAVTESEFCGGA